MTWKLISGRCLHGTDSDYLQHKYTTVDGYSVDKELKTTAFQNPHGLDRYITYVLTPISIMVSNTRNTFPLCIMPLTNTILITRHSIINNFMPSSRSMLSHHIHKTRRSIMLTDTDIQCHIISNLHWKLMSDQGYLLATLPYVRIS